MKRAVTPTIGRILSRTGPASGRVTRQNSPALHGTLCDELEQSPAGQYPLCADIGWMPIGTLPAHTWMFGADHGVLRSSPACLRMLRSVPGGNSALGLPAIVTAQA